MTHPVWPDSPPTHGAQALSRARWATRIQFLVMGLAAGTWGAHIPSVKVRYGLSDGSLSLVLLAAAMGAVSSLFVAGRLVGRWGSRRVARTAALLMCSALSLALVLPMPWLVWPWALMLGVGMCLFDVAINTEGSELERLSGRAVMSQLHGMFSVGGMLGAALAAALLAAQVPAHWQLWGVSAAMALTMLLSVSGMLSPQPRTPTEQAQAHFAWPRGVLLLIGLLIFAGMTAEGVMYDWCVLYLSQEVGMPQSQAALGYVAFAAAMAAARFGGDALRARYPERLLLRVGASLAAVAMAVVLLSARADVAWVGFALVGAGLAPVAPILFNAATRVPGVSPAAAIASVTSIGYAGFMVGPPLIGSLATTSSLTLALGVVVLAAAMLALGAARVPAGSARH